MKSESERWWPRSRRVAQAWHSEGEQRWRVEDDGEVVLLTGMVGHGALPVPARWRQDHQKVEVFLGYIVSLGPAWAT